MFCWTKGVQTEFRIHVVPGICKAGYQKGRSCSEEGDKEDFMSVCLQPVRRVRIHEPWEWAHTSKRAGPRYHRPCSTGNMRMLAQTQWHSLTKHLMCSTESPKRPHIRRKYHAPEKGPLPGGRTKLKQSCPNK